MRLSWIVGPFAHKTICRAQILENEVWISKILQPTLVSSSWGGGALKTTIVSEIVCNIRNMDPQKWLINEWMNVCLVQVEEVFLVKALRWNSTLSQDKLETIKDVFSIHTYEEFISNTNSWVFGRASALLRLHDGMLVNGFWRISVDVLQWDSFRKQKFEASVS